MEKQKVSIRRIGSLYGVVMDNKVVSNLFSNPFEFKLLEQHDHELMNLASVAVFNHFIGMFSIKNSTRKIGFRKLFYKFGTNNVQLGLIDNGILVITLPCTNPETILKDINIDEVIQARRDMNLCNSVLKNRDIITALLSRAPLAIIKLAP